MLCALADVVVVVVVKLYQLVQGLSLLPACQLLLVEQGFDLAETGAVGLVESQQQPHQLREVRRVHLLQDLEVFP